MLDNCSTIEPHTVRDQRRDDWRKKVQEWYDGQGSRLVSWGNGKTRWNAPLEQIVVAGLAAIEKGTYMNI